ncbi:MAG: hypothetical protein ACJAS1_001629 [Oleiphilaceae bacterium]|jgi:hypothetical protein
MLIEITYKLGQGRESHLIIGRVNFNEQSVLFYMEWRPTAEGGWMHYTVSENETTSAQVDGMVGHSVNHTCVKAEFDHIGIKSTKEINVQVAAQLNAMALKTYPTISVAKYLNCLGAVSC